MSRDGIRSVAMHAVAVCHTTEDLGKLNRRVMREVLAGKMSAAEGSAIGSEISKALDRLSKRLLPK